MKIKIIADNKLYLLKNMKLEFEGTPQEWKQICETIKMP